MFVTAVGILITLPALTSVGGVPVAFLAVVSIAVIGLYLAFLIPIFLRWRMGDDVRARLAGPTGSKYKWMNPIAVAEIAIISIYFILPFTPAGVPGNKDFTWSSVNYAPLLTFGTLIVLGDLVEGVGQALVHRAEAHHRRGRRQGVRRLSGTGWAGTDRDSAKSPAGSVHQCVSRSPAAASSRSTPARRNFDGDLGAHLLAAREVDVEVEGGRRAPAGRASTPAASRSTRGRRPRPRRARTRRGRSRRPGSRSSTCEHVLVELRGHALRVVVRRHQPGRVLDQVGAEQERVARTERSAHIRRGTRPAGPGRGCRSSSRGTPAAAADDAGSRRGASRSRRPPARPPRPGTPHRPPRWPRPAPPGRRRTARTGAACRTRPAPAAAAGSSPTCRCRARSASPHGSAAAMSATCASRIARSVRVG